MAAKKIDKIRALAPAPSGEAVGALAENALGALRAMHESLAKQLEVLAAERTATIEKGKALADQEARLAKEGTETKLQLAKLEELSEQVNTKREEIDSAFGRIEQEQAKLAAHASELGTRAEELARREQACASIESVIQDRERSVGKAQEAATQRQNELAARQAELDAQREDLTSRVTKVQQAEAELTAQREALASLQEQLTRDHHEIATQREELLKQLGAVPPRSSMDATPVAPALAEPAPKPAASKSAEQFRKLRRDAKRKAIGV